MRGLPRLRLFILAGVAIIVALGIFVGIKMFESAAKAVSGAPDAGAAADSAVRTLYWVAFPIAAIVAAIVAAFAVTTWRLIKQTNADLLRAGSAVLDGTAVILSAAHSGLTFGKTTALINVRLRVTAPGQSPYEAETKVKLRRRLWGLLTTGATVLVRIDPSDPQRVAVDWQNPA